jgi:hypothetical protein
MSNMLVSTCDPHLKSDSGAFIFTATFYTLCGMQEKFCSQTNVFTCGAQKPLSGAAS